MAAQAVRLLYRAAIQQTHAAGPVLAIQLATALNAAGYIMLWVLASCLATHYRVPKLLQGCICVHAAVDLAAMQSGHPQQGSQALAGRQLHRFRGVLELKTQRS